MCIRDRQKTDQLLYSLPLRTGQVVLGKYLALLTVAALACALFAAYPLVLGRFGTVNYASSYTGPFGYFCLCAALLAMGVFASSLTENQVVAAFASFGLVIGLLLLSSLSSSVTNPVLASVINWVSIYNRFQEFNYGVCSVESLIYYISITVIFLFLTVRVLEKRRWS